MPTSSRDRTSRTNRARALPARNGWLPNVHCIRVSRSRLPPRRVALWVRCRLEKEQRQMKSAWHVSSAGLAAAALAINVRSEEHTSELQSPMYLVCRLLLEKKKKKKKIKKNKKRMTICD